MEIVEFSKEYKEDTVNLLIDVAVREHGFFEWEKWFYIFENEFYKDNDRNCWIALDNDKVIETISLKKLDKELGEIKNLYIHSDYRKQGIAQKLLDILIEFATENNYNKLQLDTYDKFGNAIRFYEKNGFVKKQSIDDKYIYIKDIA